MLITRETDYALRLVRSLADGERRSVSQLSDEEQIPKAFAYKIIKKLERADLVSIARGSEGGCSLNRPTRAISLYDLMCAIDGSCSLSPCMESGYRCEWCEKHGSCCFHNHLMVIQEELNDRLKASSLEEILKCG
ncbi:Rrf2 family protein [Eubacterium maltosivorans]|uniref:Rrf2 family transcriptional regulator n=1 Tax=Eubacterium maltosivorans TaxID=2041044 RepID=A0A4P9C3Q2_EUBML|nr:MULTISPECIES: Rrf2 family transcriptional regulator [Eubacterium]MDO5433987.1 Rrf2 family transcriptional regulator [Eubacterium sp.]QCT69937.1 Rrf2 family transcriptional regulator [Eubacterium maltosivorans]WPK80685.1 HTH-type transcriptional repressor NsrR [Eubacterium maltosivorans]SDO26633.1 Rrf2 family protein [Eubacterium maltosivorans]